MSSMISKANKDITIRWTSPEGKTMQFKTEKRMIEFHTRMLSNNPFVKNFKIEK